MRGAQTWPQNGGKRPGTLFFSIFIFVSQVNLHLPKLHGAPEERERDFEWERDQKAELWNVKPARKQTTQIEKKYYKIDFTKFRWNSYIKFFFFRIMKYDWWDTRSWNEWSPREAVRVQRKTGLQHQSWYSWRGVNIVQGWSRLCVRCAGRSLTQFDLYLSTMVPLQRFCPIHDHHYWQQHQAEGATLLTHGDDQSQYSVGGQHPQDPGEGLHGDAGGSWSDASLAGEWKRWEMILTRVVHNQ